MQDPRVCTTLFHNRSGSPRLKRFFSFFLSICIPKSMSRYIIVSWKYIKRELTMESRQCSRCERRFLFIFLLFSFFVELLTRRANSKKTVVRAVTCSRSKKSIIAGRLCTRWEDQCILITRSVRRPETTRCIALPSLSSSSFFFSFKM